MKTEKMSWGKRTLVAAGVIGAVAAGAVVGVDAAFANDAGVGEPGTKPAPATLEEVLKDAEKATFYDEEQFLWEAYGMTEREFETTYGVDDDVLEPYETPAPTPTPEDSSYATEQEYEAAEDAWEAAHPGVDNDVWEAHNPNPFDHDDDDDDDDESEVEDHDEDDDLEDEDD